MAGGSSGLWLSSNYGNLFTQPSTLNTITTWQSVAVSSNGTFMIASLCCGSGGINGGIYYSTNAGITWTQSQSASSQGNRISIATNSNGSNMYAINSITSTFNTTGIAFVSTNYGNTWIQSTAPSDRRYKHVTISSSGQYVALVSTYDGISMSSDYGNTWTTASGAYNISWNDIITDSTGQYYVAVGDNSTTYSSYNFGTSFINNNPTSTLGDATGISSNGSFGFIVISTSNSGTNSPAGIYKSTNWLYLQPTTAPTPQPTTATPNTHPRNHLIIIICSVVVVVVVVAILAGILLPSNHNTLNHYEC